MSVIIARSNSVALQNTVERVDISVQDETTGLAADPNELKLTIMDLGGNEYLYDEWPGSPIRIVQSATGRFHVDFGPPTARLNGVHGIGSSTLTVNTAYPAVTSGWPSSGNLILDVGSNKETLTYTALSLVGGAGTFTLASPTTLSHANNAAIRGPNQETANGGEWLFNWQIRMSAGAEQSNVVQKIKVITPKIASLLPELRILIDKSNKALDLDHECFLGYTDANLVGYLEGGLQNINAYQPSLTFTFDNFPLEYRQILIDAALITGVMSQELYAIDTDIPSYNDQGTSFVIAHQPQLASFLNQLTQRLDKLIPQMKLQLLQPGTLHTQMGPNFRLTQLVQAAPNGSIFRGVFFKG